MSTESSIGQRRSEAGRLVRGREEGAWPIQQTMLATIGVVVNVVCVWQRDWQHGFDVQPRRRLVSLFFELLLFFFSSLSHPISLRLSICLLLVHLAFFSLLFAISALPKYTYIYTRGNLRFTLLLADPGRCKLSRRENTSACSLWCIYMYIYRYNESASAEKLRVHCNSSIKIIFFCGDLTRCCDVIRGTQSTIYIMGVLYSEERRKRADVTLCSIVYSSIYTAELPMRRILLLYLSGWNYFCRRGISGSLSLSISAHTHNRCFSPRNTD